MLWSVTPPLAASGLPEVKTVLSFAVPPASDNYLRPLLAQVTMSSPWVKHFTLTSPGQDTVGEAMAVWIENPHCAMCKRPGSKRSLRFIGVQRHSDPRFSQ